MFSSCFAPAQGDPDRDQIFWCAYDKMRLQSDDDFIALESFNQAALLADSSLKIKLALSDVWSLLSRKKSKKKEAKKIEFYLAWLNEECVPPNDYVHNLKGFHDRIKNEMNSFESDQAKIVESLPPPPTSRQLITEL